MLVSEAVALYVSDKAGRVRESVTLSLVNGGLHGWDTDYKPMG